MRKKRSNEIRTPRSGAKVGVRVVVGQEPVALVKQRDKFDTLSVQEFATALYGEGTTCVVIPASEKEW